MKPERAARQELETRCWKQKVFPFSGAELSDWNRVSLGFTNGDRGRRSNGNE